MSERFEHHARTVALLTMVSRVTGLLRVTAMSRIFGAGGLNDAFYFAFMIPNLFRRLFGEGALSAAFLPVYARLRETDEQGARALSSLLIASLAVGLGALTIIGELVLWIIMETTDVDSLALRLAMLMLPYMPLVCLVAILGAILQVRGRFGPTAAAPIIANLCVIGGSAGLWLLFFRTEPGMEDGEALATRITHIHFVAGAVLLAGVLQLAWSLWALRGEAWWTSSMGSARAHLGVVLRQAGPMILGLGVLQVNTLFDGLIASYPTVVGPTVLGVDYPLDVGAMAAVTFAQRLYQFPFGVFGIAIATAIFPALARLADGPDGPFVETIRRGLRLVLFIGLPASAGIILVREPMTRVILEGGYFTADDTNRVAFILLGYAPAIWAYSMVHVFTRAFYARGESMTPVRIALLMVGLNLALNVTLIWTPLREAGLAWSTAICAVIQAGLLGRALKLRIGRLLDRDVLASWGRTGIAVLVMTAAVAGVTLLWPWNDATWSGAFALLGGQVAAGAVTFTLAALVLRMAELRWLLHRGSAAPRPDGIADSTSGPGSGVDDRG